MFSDAVTWSVGLSNSPSPALNIGITRELSVPRYSLLLGISLEIERRGDEIMEGIHFRKIEIIKGAFNLVLSVSILDF